MYDILLSVRPAGSSWQVDCPDGLQPMHFATGAEAQEQACQLAKCLAGAGVDVRVLVLDSARRPVESTRYPPAAD